MLIKVLHLIDSGGLYGAEMMLLGLVEAQIKSGLKPLILSAGEPGVEEKPLEIEARRRGLPIKIFHMKAGVNIAKSLQVVSFARDEGFDILHSHGYKFNILLGILPRFIRKIPLIATLHGYTCVNGFSLMRLYQMVDRVLLKHMDGVVFVSGGIKNNPLFKGFKAKDETIIFNGIDASEIVNALSSGDVTSIRKIFSEGQGPQDLIYLGAIGRLSAEKGFGLLIDVFSRLVKKYPKLRLVIIGEGELQQSLAQKIASMGLAETVKLPGFIRSPYKLMAELDGVVMPSYTEGLPITLLEACVLNKRIVASNVGSIAEVLIDYSASLVVPPGEGEALEVAIEALIIANSHQPVNVGNEMSEHFTSTYMAKQYTAFYKKIIHGYHAPGLMD